MDAGLLSCHQLKSRDEGLKQVVWGGEFYPWASMLGQVEVGAVRPRTRVFGVKVVVKVWKCEEVFSLGAHHVGRDPGAELEDLATDVLEESVGGPAADEHDDKNGYSCEVHGHGAV
jgi:hypothetical protein